MSHETWKSQIRDLKYRAAMEGAETGYQSLLDELESLARRHQDALQDDEEYLDYLSSKLFLLTKTGRLREALRCAERSLGRVESYNKEALLRSVETALSEAHETLEFDAIRPFLVEASGVLAGELLHAATNVCDVPEQDPVTVRLIESFLQEFSAELDPTLENFDRVFQAHVRDARTFNLYYTSRLVDKDDEPPAPVFETKRWREWFRANMGDKAW